MVPFGLPNGDVRRYFVDLTRRDAGDSTQHNG
jgi:hypothetical protein